MDAFPPIMLQLIELLVDPNLMGELKGGVFVVVFLTDTKEEFILFEAVVLSFIWKLRIDVYYNNSQ